MLLALHHKNRASGQVANNRQTERKTTIFLPANLTNPVCLSSIMSKRVRIATTNCFGSPSRAPFDISNEVLCDSHGGDEKPLCRWTLPHLLQWCPGHDLAFAVLGRPPSVQLLWRLRLLRTFALLPGCAGLRLDGTLGRYEIRCSTFLPDDSLPRLSPELKQRQRAASYWWYHLSAQNLRLLYQPD